MVFEQRWHNDGMINMKTNHAFGATVHHTHLLICIYIYISVCVCTVSNIFFRDCDSSRIGKVKRLLSMVL